RGAALDKVAERFGGLHANVALLRDNQPGYWKGDARALDEVFAAHPGTVLRHPVPGRDGLLLVRVDRHDPASTAPLSEVAREIRARLRAEARAHADDQVLRTLYAGV